MKKKTPRNASQVNACAPLLATAPSVSSPTSVQIRKKNMSKRPKCFWSFAFSSSAAAVVCSTNSVVGRGDPGHGAILCAESGLSHEPERRLAAGGR